ncbi:type II secretion system protein GspM [Paraglaciecola hydrolytica]|uniref:Type II secretion system protein M n=1 Tax=Paraglaciecola hydrolytica TaxID=1799789 RepID=A0A135ZZ70_9ALTE|nr:type II secretion system protein M [Paraglaciecola hydrolytica]KXI28279.1 general secretion pathway protein GspM [Paraglaciecola hydrolytica]
MEKLKLYYKQLNEREQRLVLLSAVLVVIALFYWVIWSPLSQAVTKGQANLNSQKELLVWVQQNANRALQLQGSAKPNAKFTGSLAQEVNQSAGRLNITIARMQPTGEELQVWVDQVPFNDVLSWLQGLESKGIVVLDLDIAETNAAGQIKIRRLKLGKA